jgi:RHS repeat-associated protein
MSMTNGSTTATFVYDGDGNRVAKTVGTVTTQYLVDDLNPTGYPQVVEELVNSAVTRQYTYGLQRISENLSPTASGNAAWTPSFYGYDGGGNVRQLTNSVGVVTDTYEYDAFGNEVNHTGTTPNNYLYRGEQFDADLGLYCLRARYYNAGTGRFLSRDPENGKHWDPKTLHRYLYAGGDPINAKDPTGRDIIEYELGTEARYNAVEVGTTTFARDVFLCLVGAAAELKGVLSKDPDLFDVVVGDIGLLGCPVASPYFSGPTD